MTDARSYPTPRKRRRLSEAPYVTLAEALTWMAFDDAIAEGDLRSLVERQIDHNGKSSRFFDEREQGLDRIAAAWADLRNWVDRGAVKVRGRYTRYYSEDEAFRSSIRSLSGARLQTFTQFDVSTGGIRRQLRGTPTVLWSEHEQSFDREFERFAENELPNGEKRPASEGYLFVEVETRGLKEQYSPRGSPRKQGRPPQDEKIREKCDQMHDRGLNTREIAKNIRHEPGFENVSNQLARDLMMGRYPRTGRGKRRA